MAIEIKSETNGDEDPLMDENLEKHNTTDTKMNIHGDSFRNDNQSNFTSNDYSNMYIQSESKRNDIKTEHISNEDTSLDQNCNVKLITENNFRKMV